MTEVEKKDTLKPKDLGDIINTATNRDWMNINKQHGLTKADILDDIGLTMAFALFAKEKDKSSRGKGFDPYLDIPINELQELLNIDLEEDEWQEDPKA